MDILTSTKFKDFIKKYADRIKETKGKERDDEAKKSVDKTIEVLSEKQAEAITFEHIYRVNCSSCDYSCIFSI